MVQRHRFVILILLAGVAGCATLQQVLALRQVRFTLDGVGDPRLAGVDLNRIASLRDVSVAELSRVAAAVGRNELPFEFQLRIGAGNPEENQVAATLTRLAWTLYLDERETIRGVVDSAVTIPPGTESLIAIRMRLNLLEFFNGSAQDLVNLAASLAGRDADPTKITLRAIPTITTPLGPISYPTPLTIVNRTIGAP